MYQKNYIYGNNIISDNNINYISNGFNNVIITTNINGALKETYSYDDYGNRDKKYDPFIQNNEVGYNGEFHTGSSEIYLRARYYDPNTRNFINEDTYRGVLYDPIVEIDMDMEETIHISIKTGGHRFVSRSYTPVRRVQQTKTSYARPTQVSRPHTKIYSINTTKSTTCARKNLQQ